VSNEYTFVSCRLLRKDRSTISYKS